MKTDLNNYRYTHEINTVEIYAINPPAASWLDDRNWHVVDENISADEVFVQRVRHLLEELVEGRHFRFNHINEADGEQLSQERSAN